MSQCAGKNSCYASLPVKSFLKIGAKAQNIENLTVFAQVSCQKSDHHLKASNQVGLLVSFLGILMWLIYQLSLEHIYTQY